MANTSSRTLRLLSLLQSQRYWPGAELAGRLEISVRTLRRDIGRLRDLGYPVEGSRGADGGYQLAAGAALPPLALDDDEAVALAVGLQSASASQVASMAEPSLRALTKVLQVMPKRLQRQVEGLQAMTVTGSWSAGGAGPDPSVLLAASQSCRADVGLAFEYTAVDGARSERRVEPLRLVVLGRRWYLVAYDLDRQAWRNFRLDRISATTSTGRRFRPRELPAEDAAEFVRRSIRTAPQNHTVRAVLHCPATTARDRLGRWAEIEERPGDSCLLTIRTESLEWPAMALGAVGVEVSDVQPPELITLLRDWSERFARAAAASPV